MGKRKPHPTKSGFWWLTLDDGEIFTTSPILARVLVHDCGAVDVGFLQSLSEVSECEFFMETVDQRIVQTRHLSVGGLGRSTSRGADLRVTWLGEALPPRGSPAKGDPSILGLDEGAA